MAKANSSAADEPTKRGRIDRSCCNFQPPLLPGLPDHISHLCLSRVHPSSLYSVCTSWRRLIYSPSFPPFLSIYALLSPAVDELRPSPEAPADRGTCLSRIEFANFDPVASRWRQLAPPLNLLLRHPSFLSRNFPIQSVSVSGKLVVVAATADNLFSAIPFPLVFNPISGDWSSGPPLSVPRRWCAAGSSGGTVYVASGVGSHFSTDVARSVEKWNLGCTTDGRRRSDCQIWKWRRMKDMKDMRFGRDAIEAVGWMGKLHMVNVRGGSPKEGVVYDVEADTWSEMPRGMIDGWRGPVAAMDEAELYVVDEAAGALRRYDRERDAWDDLFTSEDLKDAQQIAAAGGRVCVVSGEDSRRIVVVDVAAARTWTLETPGRLQVVGLHILPRMHSRTPLIVSEDEY
ncbi:hypothetical protein SAY87_014540 [Trapa incisa]|uniref:F-box/kelch-repeat protein SKIP25 n=1 Tax=Trapa incisa TaxID=236973 RepID=A0AAN7JKG3_9MYRT|nr:hypothetical protein SAY87_014540 [Trapa incisa]